MYRNLHKDSIVIRCAKTGLVAGYCNTVRLTDARFFVSESGRAKVLEKRVRSVHAYVVGTLNAYDFELEREGKTPMTETFINEQTWEPIFTAPEVVVSYDRAFINRTLISTIPSVNIMSEIECGQMCLIDYGAFQKVATYLASENGNNVFVDTNGKFVLTDRFLTKGSVRINTLEEE
ncbi:MULTISPECIES: hypothetical protein [unclassified Paenibacillus]|uniref:hypothetical protein n=1 Tax=unclassified Paenibacillus TaxID=185978 RepID=UPI002786EEA3|nr:MULTISPECIES: hypothetical protein [unclassified Paenibacillus]MDQ0896235.1 hypothetical protein [Paenibacillus sp. V4I7]MDQ0913837.1 hypothetical protein [Paenibacillus sp. V4I5]